MKIRELLVAIKVSVEDRGAKKLADALDGIVKFAPKVEQSLAATERAAAKAAREQERAARKVEVARAKEAKAAERAAAAVEKARAREEKATVRAAERAERVVERSMSAQERAERQRVRAVEKAAADVERAKARETKAVERAIAAQERATARSVANIRQLSRQNQDKFEHLGDVRERNGATRREAAGKVGGAFGDAAGGLARGAGAFVGALAVGGGFALSKAGDMESLRARLKVLEGGEAKATETFDRIKALAQEMPSTVEEVTSALVGLRSQGLTATDEALRAHSDMASSAGKSILEWSEAVKDATTGERERLKEFGVTAKDMGDTVKFTFRGVTTEVDDNQEAVEKYLISLGKVEGVAGASAAQMATLKGVISNFEDALTNAIDEAMQTSGALEEAKGLLGDLAGGANGAATAFGTVLADGLRTVREWLSNLTAEDIKGWLDSAVTAGMAMIDMISGAVNAFMALADVAKTMSEALGLSDGAVTTLTLAFGALALAGGGLPGVFAAVAVAAAAMGTAVGNAIGGMDNEIWIIEQRIKELKLNIADMQATEAELRGELLEDAADDEEKLRLRGKGARFGREGEAAIAEAQFDAVAAANRSGFGEEFFATAEEQAGGKSIAAMGTAEQAALARAGGSAGLSGSAGRAKMRLDAARARELDRLRKSGVDTTGREAGIAANEQKARKAFTDAIRKGKTEEEAIDAAERTLLSEGKAKTGKKGGKGKKDPAQKDLLEQLGLKGPGSILEDRPSPQALTISMVVTVKLADQINVPITMPPGSTFEGTGEQAGKLVGETMSKTIMADITPVVEEMIALRFDDLGKRRGGGRVPRTARKGGPV
jgi:hypothetical protein